jgi:hypothetical protein
MPEYYFIGFWNLENLFDIEKSPRRSDKLQRVLRNELKGWTAKVLDRKVSQLASIILQLNQNRGPDILGVCEVENRYVLELLSERLNPPGRDYRIVHADTQDQRGIDVAFIYDASRFGAEDVFSHFIVKRVATRDLVQVNFRTASGRMLIIVGNHWPARSGGRWQTDPYRLIAGETLAYFHERIREEQGAEAAILAMGDFNDEPFDRSLVEYARSERQRAKVTLAASARFLNLMWKIAGQSAGTFYFDNFAHVLDQFLVSKGLLTGNGGVKVVEDSARIEKFTEMTGPLTYPVPIRFGRGRSLNVDGFSDHFPISVAVRES